MKRLPFPLRIRTGIICVAILLAAGLLAAGVRAQANQLSLADILIALRSKKVTLADRNKILSEAIAARGTTFRLTPEIEKELTDTGASKALLDSIRQRTQSAKLVPAAEAQPKIEVPKTQPPAAAPVQDRAFYEARAQQSAAKGDLDAALVDYTKAAEIDGSAVSVLIGRGRVYFARKAYLLAIADYTKVIDLEPKNAAAFAQRAEANDKQGNAALALDDYKKAYELDPTIESAKAAVERFNVEQAKSAERSPVPQPVTGMPAFPEYIDLGQLNEQRAIRMVKPIYPAGALRSGFGGQVVVEVEMDTAGNVTKAKAVSGNALLRKASEDAAVRSKFHPAMVGTAAVKAKARIVYDFIARQ